MSRKFLYFSYYYLVFFDFKDGKWVLKVWNSNWELIINIIIIINIKAYWGSFTFPVEFSLISDEG